MTMYLIAIIEYESSQLAQWAYAEVQYYFS